MFYLFKLKILSGLFKNTYHIKKNTSMKIFDRKIDSWLGILEDHIRKFSSLFKITKKKNKHLFTF